MAILPSFSVNAELIIWQVKNVMIIYKIL